MPLPSERPFRWRHSPDSPIMVTAAAFARLVAENHLEPFDIGGYRWAFVPTEDGYDTYRTQGVDWDAVPVTLASTADPAAGADPAVITVPAGKRWLFLSAYTELTCSADVASRLPILKMTNGTNSILQAATGAVITASQVRYLTWANTAFTHTSSVTAMSIAIPHVELAAGYTVEIDTTSIQAADDYTPIRYRYKEVDA